MESFEKQGTWWIPGRDDAAVGGMLSFESEGGLHLSLLGALRDDVSSFYESFPVLFGFVDGMGMVTLADCRPAGTRILLPGPAFEAYCPAIALVGAHIPNPESQQFGKARLALDHLSDWVHEGGMSLALARQPHAATPIKLEYSYPREKTARLDLAKLTIGFMGKTGGDLLNQFTISQGVHVDVEPTHPLSIGELFEALIAPLQGFLAFATERAADVTSLTVFSDDILIDVGSGRTRRCPIGVYLPTRHSLTARERQLHPHDFLFMFQDIEPQFEGVMARWFDLYRDLPHCLNLLTGTYYSPHLHLDRVFLILAQVSEILHRQHSLRTKMPRREFTRRVELIRERTPSWLADWTIPYLTNELSFAERLEELVDDYGECVLPLRASSAEFVRSAVDTRNYYTHYSSKLKAKAARGKDLLLLTQALSVLVRCCVLARLGVTGKERKRLLLRNQAFLFPLRESKNPQARALFACKDADERNRRILAACDAGQMTQRQIAALAGLSASAVSRIVKSLRAAEGMSG